MYKLIFEKKALHNLEKINQKDRKRIWNKLQDCKIEPFRFLKPILQIKGFKLRVGDYRVIIDVREEIRILNVLKVGHRKNIYEK